MGHTIPQKRQIINHKLGELRRFARGLREPYRGRLLALADSCTRQISTIVLCNSSEDEEMIVLAMLTERCRGTDWQENPRALRCLCSLLCDSP